MYQAIKIDKQNKFFVALCKYSAYPPFYSFLSFICLGVEIDNKNVILGAFGKSLGKDYTSCGFFFNDTTSWQSVEQLAGQNTSHDGSGT